MKIQAVRVIRVHFHKIHFGEFSFVLQKLEFGVVQRAKVPQHHGILKGTS
jgi:hypothetical protein